MRFFETFKRKNGNYVTQEWSGEEMLNYDILKLAFMLVIGSILTVLSSAVCLFVKLYDYEENQKAPSIFGIIFSLYFLIDYKQGWIVSFILRFFEDENWMRFIFACNLSLLITHILLLIFGDTIFYKNKGEGTAMLVIWTLVAFTITLICAYSPIGFI